MVFALHGAGFYVYDVTMYDLCNESVDLERIQGLVFVGGFSYIDVFGSAKGWAALSMLNLNIQLQLERFYDRSDTFSLGVCNGCQLMALLGWVGGKESSETPDVCFSHNTSERFESRFVHVKVIDSPSIILKGMKGLHMGIWIAHGEGRLVFKSPKVLPGLISDNLAPI